MSIARRSLQVVAFIATLIVGVASMAVIVTQTVWFKEWLRGFIVRQAEDYVNGRLSIGRLDGNLFFGVELEDIDVTMNGKQVVEVKDAGLDYNLFTFIKGNVVLDDIRLNKPTVRLEKTADGWNITELIKARTPNPEEPKTRPPIEIGEIGITDGALELGGQPIGTSGVNVPERIQKLNASVGVKSDENALDVKIGHISLEAEGPRLHINDLSGRIVRTPSQVHFEDVALRTDESSLRVNGTIHNIEGTPAVDVAASSDKFAIGEIARLVPALRGMDLQPAFELTAKGPADRMAVDLDAREKTVGHVIGDLTVDAAAPGKRVAGAVTMEHFNFGPIAKSATLKSDITGRGRIDLALPSGRMPLSGSYSIDASYVKVAGYEARDLEAKGRIDGATIRFDGNAAAYGGRAAAAGTVKTGTPLILDVRGRAAGMDLRNMPPQLSVPGVPSNLDLDYHVTGRDKVFSGEVQLYASTLAGASIAPGTTGTFKFGAGAPSYTAKGSVSNLDIQQIGRGFDITALKDDKYRSRVNGTFTVSGSGGGSTPLNLDASGSLFDSTIFGASMPRMDVTTKISPSDMRVRALGQFAGLDPAVAAGNGKVAGKLTGAVDADLTLRNFRDGVTMDSIDASGRVKLGGSTLAGVAIDSAVVDGRYGERSGEINQLSIKGPDVNVQGQGTFALTETGASNMQVHLETPVLERVGEIVGQPLKGSALVDATITGNGRELNAAGTLKGSNIGHGDNEALNLDTTFTASIPDLTPANASVKAESHATFVEVAGQKINELTARTTYVQQKLEFDTVAKEGVRELGAAGSVVFHPDHQEIHLGNLSLRSGTVGWRTEPGSEATIQYGKDRIAVRDVRLVNADQRIEANGVIGSTTEPLEVAIENVDVAQIDQLMLTSKGIGGRLNANATVSGRTDDIHADGEFTLAQGSFQKFTFESFVGKVQYGAQGMNVDVRLQQNPQAWLTAKGYVPTALFSGETGAAAGHEHEAAPPGEAIDVEVHTSQIDLGVIQGFTSYVTNVAGSLQANVKVTGSAHDPHTDGVIEVRGGALAVPELGTAYTGIDTRVDLKPDSVSISEMRIVDEHNKVLTIGGTLGVHERAVGAVDIKIQSDGFEFIDNKLADLKLDTNLHVTGEVREPRVEGQLEVETGSVNVTEVLELATGGPYSTSETDLAPAEAAEAPKAPTPTVFDNLDMNIALSIPGNLVLKGDDLRTANAPISIGDINVTVGGLMQIRKPRGGNGLRLTGEVNTVRGNYDFQGRRFELMRDGRIRFTGTDVIDPILDLKARREISGVEAFINVRGTLRRPELAFSSNPPLEEADVLALIVFNQPINELGEGQQVSLAEQAAAFAGGYVASGLARSIGEALELDQFEIETAGATGGPTLTLGEQVGQNLFFRVRQGFGAAQATELIIEYQLADYLRLQASVAETAGGTQRAMFHRVERGGIDVIFFFNY